MEDLRADYCDQTLTYEPQAVSAGDDGIPEGALGQKSGMF